MFLIAFLHFPGPCEKLSKILVNVFLWGFYPSVKDFICLNDIFRFAFEKDDTFYTVISWYIFLKRHLLFKILHLLWTLLLKECHCKSYRHLLL